MFWMLPLFIQKAARVSDRFYVERSTRLTSGSTLYRLRKDYLKNQDDRSSIILRIFVLPLCNRPHCNNLYFQNIGIFHDIFPLATRCPWRNLGWCPFPLLYSQTRLQNIDKPSNRKTGVCNYETGLYLELTELTGNPKKRTGKDYQRMVLVQQINCLNSHNHLKIQFVMAMHNLINKPNIQTF